MWAAAKMDLRACELCYHKEKARFDATKRQLWEAAELLQQTELDLTLCLETLNSSLGKRFYDAKADLDEVSPQEGEANRKKEMASEELEARWLAMERIEP